MNNNSIVEKSSIFMTAEIDDIDDEFISEIISVDDPYARHFINTTDVKKSLIGLTFVLDKSFLSLFSKINFTVIKEFFKYPTKLLFRFMPRHTFLEIGIRTFYIEKCIQEFIRDGGLQIVFCGAGYDTLPLRLDSLTSRHTVYEIDFPSIIKFKEKVLSSLEKSIPRQSSCKIVRIGSNLLNFQQWKQQLINNGFKRDKPSLFILEGFLMFWTLEQTESLLKSFLSIIRDLFKGPTKLLFRFTPKHSVLEIGIKVFYIERTVLDFIKEGGTQIVVCGSGFESWPLRLGALNSNHTVFELDLPDMINLKEKVLGSMKIEKQSSCNIVRLGTSLYEPDHWKSQLLKKGFDPTKPSLWIIESLVMFFTEDQAHQLIKSISEFTDKSQLLLETFKLVPPSNTKNTKEVDLEIRQVTSFCKDNFKFTTDDPTVYSYIPDSKKDDVDKAVEAAKNAFYGWSTKSVQERALFLNKIADGIEKRFDEFVVAESKDQGKPEHIAKLSDVQRSIVNIRFYASLNQHSSEQSTQMDGNAFNYTIKTPIGVAGLITPWNFPLNLLTWKLAPAIIVGNTCVCKPSEMTSMTAYLLCEVIRDAGLPAGVINMVFGTGANAGSALVEHPNVPLISFTGGTKTGATISKSAAPYFKRLGLELGGKNPALIFDDCNLEECVATTVRSSYFNQGEVCVCTSRIFVQEGIFDKFVEKFIEKSKEWKVGDPKDSNSNMGPLISADHLKKVEYYVDLARQEGGKILLGGSRIQVGPEGSPLRNGYFYPPTIITGLKPDGRVMQEEIFGPVVSIYPFKTEEDALSLANNTPYGLAATVWTENGKKAHRVASRVQSGVVWINSWMIRDLRTPFGGFKMSGLGREGGEYSLDFFTEQKNICFKL
eukprot:gene5645-7028_t